MNDKGDPTSRQDFMRPSTPKPTAKADVQPTQRAMTEAERRIGVDKHWPIRASKGMYLPLNSRQIWKPLLKAP